MRSVLVKEADFAPILSVNGKGSNAKYLTVELISLA